MGLPSLIGSKWSLPYLRGEAHLLQPEQELTLHESSFMKFLDHNNQSASQEPVTKFYRQYSQQVHSAFKRQITLKSKILKSYHLYAPRQGHGFSQEILLLSFSEKCCGLKPHVTDEKADISAANIFKTDTQTTADLAKSCEL